MTNKFLPGCILMTRGVQLEVTRSSSFSQFVTGSLKRHLSGDWGDLSQGDKDQNELALTQKSRLFSAYENGSFPKIWIITEADRSATTILFPDEY